MSNPFDQNYFGDNYYSFETNSNNSYFDRSRPQLRPQLVPKSQTYPGGSRPPVPNNNNNYYRRRQQPYYGQNNSAFGGQYRAQVIDYSNGSDSKNMSNNQQIGAYNSNQMTNTCSQPLTSRSQSGLLPTPQAYQNMRSFDQQLQPLLSTPNRGLLPLPNSSIQQRFGSLPPHPQQINAYSTNNQSIPQPIPAPIPYPYSQSQPQLQPQPVPQPVPPPTQLPEPEPPNPTQQLLTKIKTESDIESQRKLEESRIESMVCEGMESRFQNDLKGFYCLFCEVFCNNVLAAERHVETPKHQRTKIGDNLRGIDSKFTIKSERISETAVALARKEELNKISNVIKNDYFNEGIRLKDGIGSDAYICENCGLSIDSLVAVKQHLELHKQFAEQLKVCSKPVIGLDFIVEYVDPNPNRARVYECTMCRTFNTTREIITHVCSFLHRTNFIKKIHPSEGLKYSSDTPQLSLEAGKRALELETLVGRGQFKVKHQSAPQNSISKSLVSHQYNSCEPTIPVPSTPNQSQPLIQDLPKHKAEHLKSPLEKLFCVELSSESEAEKASDVVNSITKSVMDYHMKGLSPETRLQFERQFQNNEQNL